jgi:hypothetical protein
MDNQLANRVSWLVGFIEGDGSLYLDRHINRRGYWKVTPNIGITNMDYGLIERCIEILSENNVPHFVTHRMVKNGVVYDIKIRGYKRVKKALDVFGDLFMSTKKDKADLKSNLIKIRLSKEHNAEFSDPEKDIYQQYRNLADLTSKGKKHLKASTIRG